MNRTKIQWTDYSWNPVTGCKHDCPYCYARAMYHRFGTSYEPTFYEDRLDQPCALRKPRRVFVCSVADLFGEWVPEEWIRAVLDTVRKTMHTYQFLTKNPRRYREFNPWPQNAWLGATATNQTQWDEAATWLPLADCSIRFISAEPLLARIDPGDWCPQWLIIGPCTGKQAQQPDPEWVCTLEQLAHAHGTPIYYEPYLLPNHPKPEFPSPGALFATNAK